jgi:hypothetical protein
MSQVDSDSAPPPLQAYPILFSWPEPTPPRAQAGFLGCFWARWATSRMRNTHTDTQNPPPYLKLSLTYRTVPSYQRKTLGAPSPLVLFQRTFCS